MPSAPVTSSKLAAVSVVVAITSPIVDCGTPRSTRWTVATFPTVRPVSGATAPTGHTGDDRRVSGSVLVFDGDCGFCTASARFLERYIRPPARVVAWQHADLAEIGLTRAQGARAGPGGGARRPRGARAGALRPPLPAPPPW